VKMFNNCVNNFIFFGLVRLIELTCIEYAQPYVTSSVWRAGTPINHGTY
jgi:hypothetical protein